MVAVAFQRTSVALPPSIARPLISPKPHNKEQEASNTLGGRAAPLTHATFSFIRSPKGRYLCLTTHHSVIGYLYQRWTYLVSQKLP